MGQSQSTADNTADVLHKADYYELLGVERTATDDELKKAYRRKALELHPDRNYGSVEETTSLFAEIQSAYEVLSDPQERAWYDSHRDILLRGGQDQSSTHEYSYNVRMTTADEVLKLMLKFNGRLDYSDSSNGFYGGLQDFFSRLAREEEIAGQWEGEDSREYPTFGHENDGFDDVVKPFYAAWNGFATQKSYSWKDQYRLSDAPDRRIRRLMEKENKRMREDAIREYNDAVRSLVAFVRKRDHRYQENLKSEAERQKILRDAAAAQAQRSRAAREAKLRLDDPQAVPEWARSRTTDEHEGGFSSDSERENHQYECVVCDKVFKSEAQLDAHERSKKHAKLLKQLARDMRNEDDDLNEITIHPQTNGKARSDDDAIDQSDIEVGAKSPPQDGPDRELGHEEMPIRPRDQENASSLIDIETSDEDYAPRSEVEYRINRDDISDLTSALAESNMQSSATPLGSESESLSTNQQPKLGKAKQKRAKKAAAAAQKAPDASQNATYSDSRCMVCQSSFPSKTKLFDHIKKVGHAAPVSQVKAGGKGKTR